MVNLMFESGAPEMIRIHNSEQEKHPAEEIAFKHARNPHAPCFIPAPVRKRPDFVPPSIRPDESWCYGCRMYHPVSQFHKDRTRPSGLKNACTAYRAAERKMGPRKLDPDWTWHRTPR